MKEQCFLILNKNLIVLFVFYINKTYNQSKGYEMFKDKTRLTENTENIQKQTVPVSSEKGGSKLVLINHTKLNKFPIQPRLKMYDCKFIIQLKSSYKVYHHISKCLCPDSPLCFVSHFYNLSSPTVCTSSLDPYISTTATSIASFLLVPSLHLIFFLLSLTLFPQFQSPP